MNRSINLFFVFLISVSVLTAQQDETKSLSYDTAYIKDLSDKLSVRIYGVNKFNKFGIHDDSSGQSIQYSPNSNLNLGLGVNYKWFGIGLAFNFPFVNSDNEIYGKTQRFDAQTNIFTRKLAIDFYLQTYKGFYIENPDSYKNGWTEDSIYPKRPDVITTGLGGSVIYTFNNRKYSARAAFNQTEFQKKSAGSFLLGSFFSIFNLSGDSSLIPYELKEVYDNDLLFRNVSVSGTGITFGYTHTFVLWKKLYLSLTLVPGVSLQYYDIKYEHEEDNKTGTLLAGKFLGRLAIVYNSERSYVGFTAINDSFSGNSGLGQKNSLNYEIGVVRLFYGRRFNFEIWK